jgi:hypothetical protein
MALGDLNRIESAFAEATLDPALWGRALDIQADDTGSFGATLLPLAGVAIPKIPATETAGEALEHYFRDGWHLIEQRHPGVPLLLKTPVADDNEQSMPFDMHQSTPSRCKKNRITDGRS